MSYEWQILRSLVAEKSLADLFQLQLTLWFVHSRTSTVDLIQEAMSVVTGICIFRLLQNIVFFSSWDLFLP